MFCKRFLSSQYLVVDFYHSLAIISSDGDLYYRRASDYSSIFDVPYLSGCCMVARSSAFESVGGFDETYFVFEDGT